MRCTVCLLEPRKALAIDEALRGTASLQQISAEHGVSKSSLWRHTKHVTAEALVDRTQRNAQHAQRNALDSLNTATRNKCISLLLSGKPSAILQAARLAGVTRKTILEYKRHIVDKAVAIAAELEQGRAQAVPWAAANSTQTTTEVAKALPVLAVREKRLQALQDRHDRLDLVMNERAEDMARVPGGKSGLLVRQVKQIGSGESARVVEEYKLDTGLLAEFREHERQMAIELGEWDSGAPATVTVAQVILFPKVADREPTPPVTVDALPATKVEP